MLHLIVLSLIPRRFQGENKFKTCEKVGASDSKLNTNYVEVTTEAEAIAYFALDPVACKSLKTKGEERKVK